MAEKWLEIVVKLLFSCLKFWRPASSFRRCEKNLWYIFLWVVKVVIKMCNLVCIQILNWLMDNSVSNNHSSLQRVLSFCNFVYHPNKLTNLEERINTWNKTKLYAFPDNHLRVLSFCNFVYYPNKLTNLEEMINTWHKTKLYAFPKRVFKISAKKIQKHERTVINT